MPEIPSNALAIKARLKGTPGVFQIAGVPGLHLAVYGNGKGSWRIRYRPRRGAEKRWFTIGDARTIEIRDAIKKSRELIAQIQLEGKDPQDARPARSKDNRVIDLLDDYLEERKADLKPRSHGEITRHLKWHWLPLRNHKVAAISRPDVVRVLDEIVESRGTGAADRARSALSSFFDWAIDRGYAEENPTVSIKARNPKPNKTRVLSDSELREVWRACLDDEFGTIVKLLILTLQRRAEIGALAWTEIQQVERQILLPEVRTKNSRPHLVPLSPLAWELIENVPRRIGRNLLFGRGLGGYGGWTKSKGELESRIELARLQAGNNEPMQPWTLHDLRRTGSTHLHEKGIAQPHVVEAILNHISGHQAGVAGVYNKALYLAERRAALDAWGNHIGEIVK